jgi:sulfoquinovose isomerase
MALAQPHGSDWTTRPHHRAWLARQAEILLDQFQPVVIDPKGGFFDLDERGLPKRESPKRGLIATGRLVHSFAVAQMMGRPGAATIVDHGMKALWTLHRDPVAGGYPWEAGPGADTTRQAYGHAFVLLAASSASLAGHPDAARVIADVTNVILDRFWEARHGAVAEEFDAAWKPLSGYRGQNANMHMTEALMAAFEATGEARYLEMAEQIATRVIHTIARAHDWHVFEHFDAEWQPDTTYRGSDMFRPFGTTPGHALEWSRLIAQLDALNGGRLSWTVEASRALFTQAVTDGWDAATGGFYYTLDYSHAPSIRDRLWWPACEAVAAAAFLRGRGGDDFFEVWYRRVWDWSAQHMLDRSHGGWLNELDDSLTPRPRFFDGKFDIYHALQACLIPLYPAQGSLGAMVRVAAQAPS